MESGAAILIVDDDPDFRELLRQALEISEYRVFEAGDGQEGIQVMKSERIDLAIVDLDMPMMNGIDFTKTVKAASPQLPIMMITGYAQLYSPGDILASGVDAFLQKPVDWSKILSAIERL
jgi:CheY-like chemotaxis protein